MHNMCIIVLQTKVPVRLSNFKLEKSENCRWLKGNFDKFSAFLRFLTTFCILKKVENVFSDYVSTVTKNYKSAETGTFIQCSRLVPPYLPSFIERRYSADEKTFNPILFSKWAHAHNDFLPSSVASRRNYDYLLQHRHNVVDLPSKTLRLVNCEWSFRLT